MEPKRKPFHVPDEFREAVSTFCYKLENKRSFIAVYMFPFLVRFFEAVQVQAEQQNHSV